MVHINRERIKENFANYTSRYNIQDEKIKLKIDHTYRVADLCEEIARSLFLSEEDVDLAWLMGMLHDIGRFEQLRQYGTFSDADSIDHAQFGVFLLFDQGLLEQYLPAYAGDKLRYIIRKSISNHSAYRIEEGLDDRTLEFCKILRDADKIDILKVNHDIPLEKIYNVTTQDLRQSAVTEDVMKAFMEKHAILRSLKKTPADNVVGHISLVFELEYTVSYHIVAEQGYLKKLLLFQSDNPITMKQFESLRECMKAYYNTCI